MSVVLFMAIDVDTNIGSFDEVTQAAFPPAGVERMLALPTLQWKIWLTDPANSQVGGLYLFAAREAAEAYAEKSAENIRQRPGISGVKCQIWTISEEKTRLTMGPIDVPQIKDHMRSMGGT